MRAYFCPKVELFGGLFTIERSIRKRLNRYKYNLKNILGERLGVNDTLRNMTLLQIAIKDTRDALDAAITNLDRLE